MSTLPCPFSLYFFILPPFSCFFYNTYKFPPHKKYRIRPVWLNPVFFHFTVKTPSGLFYSDFQSFVYTILCIYPYLTVSFSHSFDYTIRCHSYYFLSIHQLVSLYNVLVVSRFFQLSGVQIRISESEDVPGSTSW